MLDPAASGAHVKERLLSTKALSTNVERPSEPACGPTGREGCRQALGQAPAHSGGAARYLKAPGGAWGGGHGELTQS